MDHTITKDDLQWLLAEYYKLDKIETYLKECVLLYYPSAEEYVKNEKQFKEEIATMMSREKQKLLVASSGHKGQHHKTPEQLLETELRRKINDKISALYRKIGKMIYGEDEYHKYKPKETRTPASTPITPAIASIGSSPITPIHYDDVIVETSNVTSIVNKIQQEEEEEKDDDSGIRNPYQDLDEEFQKELKPNPNFSLHHFSIPANVLVVAPAGSGKTSFLYQW